MATTCGNCGGRTRKGMARRAFVLADGVLTPARVCAGCFSRATPVVAPPPTTIAPACATPGCKRGLAAFCEHCMGRVADHARELTVQNTVLGTRPRAKKGRKA